MWVDYWGRGAGYVGLPLKLFLGGGMWVDYMGQRVCWPPSQIIWGGGGATLIEKGGGGKN